jgi:hypothetical protein
MGKCLTLLVDAISTWSLGEQTKCSLLEFSNPSKSKVKVSRIRRSPQPLLTDRRASIEFCFFFFCYYFGNNREQDKSKRIKVRRLRKRSDAEHAPLWCGQTSKEEMTAVEDPQLGEVVLHATEPNHRLGRDPWQCNPVASSNLASDRKRSTRPDELPSSSCTVTLATIDYRVLSQIITNKVQHVASTGEIDDQRR